jgi:photosystem II stability/assembly factor-like uncharacterized protein
VAVLALLAVLASFAPAPLPGRSAPVAGAQSIPAWTRLGPEGGVVTVVLADPSAGSRIYAGLAGGGVFRSTDGGLSWSATTLTNPHVHAIAADPAAPGTLYAGTDAGLMKSTDQGATWSPTATVPGGAIEPVVVAPVTGNPSMVVAGSTAGIAVSGDGGANWQMMNSGLTSLAITSLATTPDGSLLYAGTSGGGLFRSPRTLVNWTPVNAGISGTIVLTVRIDSRAPATVYAGMDGTGIYRSLDGGATWALRSTGLGNTVVRSIIVDPGDSNMILAATDNGVCRSIDGAETWTDSSSGLVSRAAHSLDIATGGGGSNPAFVGTDAGVFRVGVGASSSASNSGLTAAAVNAIAVEPNAPATLYAGTPGGVYKSLNSGGRWDAVNNGLTSVAVTSVAADPSTPSTAAVLYAGTDGGGVFRTANGGTSWTAVNSGLTNRQVRVVAVDPRTLLGPSPPGPLSRRSGRGGGLGWCCSSNPSLLPLIQ